MNTELYQEYNEYIDDSLGFLSLSFNLPEHLLEEEFRNAYPRIEKSFDPEKAGIKAYANKIFKHTAIDIAKSFKGNHPDPEFDIAEYDRYINQERQVIFKDAIDRMSETSRKLVDWILAENIPAQEAGVHNKKEKTHIKEILIQKGWKIKTITECFAEIQQTLQEVAG